MTYQPEIDIRKLKMQENIRQHNMLKAQKKFKLRSDVLEVKNKIKTAKQFNLI